MLFIYECYISFYYMFHCFSTCLPVNFIQFVRNVFEPKHGGIFRGRGIFPEWSYFTTFLPLLNHPGGDIFRTIGLLSPIINYPSQGITFACENNRGILSARKKSIRGDACRTFEMYPPDHYIGDTLYHHTGPTPYSNFITIPLPLSTLA